MTWYKFEFKTADGDTWVHRIYAKDESEAWAKADELAEHNGYVDYRLIK